MSRPTRATSAGRAYLDPQNLAHRANRLTDELHQIYALECFLVRLSRSPYADRLILKGGVLLAAPLTSNELWAAGSDGSAHTS